MRNPIFYKCVRPILFMFIKLYRPIYIGKEFIPTNENFILAGNHTSYLDPILVGSTTKNCVHFLAKDSLNKGIKKYIFNLFGIIPVNRNIKDKNALKTAINYLNNNYIIGIFPEGTINKTNELLLPFKYGAVKMAKETNTKIVPFAIKNKYILFKKSVIIKIGKPYLIKEDLKIENEILMNKIKNLIIEKEDV